LGARFFLLRFGMRDRAPPYGKTFYTECSENTENTEKKIQHGSPSTVLRTSSDPPRQSQKKS
jgi:hypothetical protein